MIASTPDFLRLLAVPVLGWAAWRDVKTRRVPNRIWYPLAALALVLLVWEGAAALGRGDVLFLLRAAISVGFVASLATAFWYMGSFGGADAKAFYVVALLFPTYPFFYLGELSAALPYRIPLEPTPIGVFSLTILSNTVVVGVCYPLAVAVGNLLRRNVGWPMLVGKPVRWEGVTDEYGVLLETPDGFTRGGLDLDALRMYLRWRGATMTDLRADPDGFRDPASLPAVPNEPGDGGLATDGGIATVERTTDGAATDDPWGARAFLDDIDHSAYGTDPDQLRDGLRVLTTADEVWISPGIPFLVPTFFGVLLSLTYGDALFTLVAAVGLA